MPRNGDTTGASATTPVKWLPPAQVSVVIGILGGIRIGIISDLSRPSRQRALAPLEALERVLEGPNPDWHTVVYLVERLTLELDKSDPDEAKLLRDWSREMDPRRASRGGSKVA